MHEKIISYYAYIQFHIVHAEFHAERGGKWQNWLFSESYVEFILLERMESINSSSY